MVSGRDAYFNDTILYKKKTYNIVYGLRSVINEHYTKWFSNKDNILKLAIMTGTYSYYGLTRKFIINEKGDEANVGVDPNSVYFFQRGKIYFDDLNKENIKISVNPLEYMSIESINIKINYY